MTPELPEHLLIDEQGRMCEAVPTVVEMLSWGRIKADAR